MRSKLSLHPADLSLMHTNSLSFARARTVSPPSLLGLGDRRQGLSDLERASAILASAVEYLVSEQLAGRRHSLPANREAIALLAAASCNLLQTERREPAKASIAAWLRGASLFRALQHRLPDSPAHERAVSRHPVTAPLAGVP